MNVLYAALVGTSIAWLLFALWIRRESDRIISNNEKLISFLKEFDLKNHR
jgi:hypothetical protein